MIDLVYPLGPGSMADNFEIIHSLLTVHKYMVGVRNIYIIGDEPPEVVHKIFTRDGYDKVIHVPIGNEGRNPQDSIRRKIELACHMPEVTDPFLFMNDDFFLRSPLEARTAFAYGYYSNLARAYGLKRKQGHYKRALFNTLMILAERGLELKYYDIHLPILYHKKSFLWAMEQYDWNMKDGFVIKSLYANTCHIKEFDAIEMTDCNINYFTTTRAEIEAIIPADRAIFAVGQNGLNDNMKDYIKSLL